MNTTLTLFHKLVFIRFGQELFPLFCSSFHDMQRQMGMLPCVKHRYKHVTMKRREGMYTVQDYVKFIYSQKDNEITTLANNDDVITLSIETYCTASTCMLWAECELPAYSA